MTQHSVFRAMNHRIGLLNQRAFLEEGLATARTVGDVWRIGRQLDAVEQHLLDNPADARPKPAAARLDDATLERLRAAVGLPETSGQS